MNFVSLVHSVKALEKIKSLDFSFDWKCSDCNLLLDLHKVIHLCEFGCAGSDEKTEITRLAAMFWLIF